MKVGYLGSGAGAEATVRCLSASYEVVHAADGHADGATPAGIARTADLAALARSSDVIIAYLSSHRLLREMLFATGGLSQGLSAGKIVIDQSSADPEQTKKLSDELH